MKVLESYTQRAEFRQIINWWLHNCDCVGSEQPDFGNFKLEQHGENCTYRNNVERIQRKKKPTDEIRTS